MLREMYPHTLTAWRPVKDGRAVRWAPLGQMPCRWDAERATGRGTDGDEASWEASVLVPDRSAAPPLQARDRVAPLATDADDPPAGSLSVVRCDPVSVGGPLPDHWEAVAR